jgi:tetratricopeptide (TPR) repeat protein
MDGRILMDALSADFINQAQPQSIASWEPFHKTTKDKVTSEHTDREMMENLAALGYIGDSSSSGSGEATSSYFRNLANLYLSEKKYDQAQKALRESMSRGVIFESYEILFELQKAQGKIKDAGDSLRKGYEQFPNIPDTTALRIVDFYVQHGMVNEAEDFLQQNESRIRDENSRTYCHARINEGAGKIDKAEAQYKAILTFDPTFMYALERLYQIVNQRGNVEVLRNIAQAGLKRNNQLGLYHNVMGVVHKKAGQFPEAIHEYNEALQLEPDNAMYMANLGAAFLSMNQPEQALEVLKRAKQRNPQDPEIWINLGAVYGTLGQTANGLEAFNKALSLGVDSPNIALGIAALHAQEGRIQEAIEVLEKAKTRFPGNPDLNELLKMLRQEAAQKGG